MTSSASGDARASGLHAGTSVLQECLRIQADHPQRSALASFFGRSPLRHEARDWYVGAVGQSAVSTQLRELGDGWTVLQTVPVGTRAAEVGHLVIGPPGVFSILTVVADGSRASVAGDVLTLGRHRTDHVARAQAEAENAATTLSAIAGAPIAVTPVVVLVGASMVVGGSSSPKPQSGTKTRSKSVRATSSAATPASDVLSSARIVRWLSLRSSTLTSAAVAGISTIASSDRWSVLAPLTDDRARRQQRFERLQREVETAKKRRRAWIVATCVVIAGGLALGLIGTLGLVTGTVAALALA